MNNEITEEEAERIAMGMINYNPEDPKNASWELKKASGMRALSKEELEERAIKQAPMMMPLRHAALNRFTIEFSERMLNEYK